MARKNEEFVISRCVRCYSIIIYFFKNNLLILFGYTSPSILQKDKLLLLLIISRWTTWIVWKISLIPIQFTVERRAESFFLITWYVIFYFVTLRYCVTLHNCFITLRIFCYTSLNVYKDWSYFRCLKMNVNNVRNIA
jgi:hypothetical protein